MPSQSLAIRKNVVFVDNLKDHWKTDKIEDMSVYSEWMEFIKIPNRRISNRETYTNTLAKMGNLYAQSLLRQKGREVNSEERITCGINKRIADALKTWSKLPPLSNKYALFDWDGTICCTNLPGSELMPYAPNRTRKNRKIRMPPKKYLDDMFVYMIHPERVQMIRDLFQTLRLNGVHMRILTQNPAASIQNPQHRAIYIEMIWRLFNEDRHTEYEKQYREEDGSSVRIYSSTSSSAVFVSREEINATLHSTIDYTRPDELPLKRNIIRYIS